jgi:hypothetical protein
VCDLVPKHHVENISVHIIALPAKEFVNVSFEFSKTVALKLAAFNPLKKSRNPIQVIKAGKYA